MKYIIVDSMNMAKWMITTMQASNSLSEMESFQDTFYDRQKHSIEQMAKLYLHANNSVSSCSVRSVFYGTGDLGK